MMGWEVRLIASELIASELIRAPDTIPQLLENLGLGEMSSYFSSFPHFPEELFPEGLQLSTQ